MGIICKNAFFKMHKTQSGKAWMKVDLFKTCHIALGSLQDMSRCTWRVWTGSFSSLISGKYSEALLGQSPGPMPRRHMIASGSALDTEEMLMALRLPFLLVWRLPFKGSLHSRRMGVWNCSSGFVLGKIQKWHHNAPGKCIMPLKMAQGLYAVKVSLQLWLVCFMFSYSLDSVLGPSWARIQ